VLSVSFGVLVFWFKVLQPLRLRLRPRLHELVLVLVLVVLFSDLLLA
jgi:hypothetical protein